MSFTVIPGGDESSRKDVSTQQYLVELIAIEFYFHFPFITIEVDNVGRDKAAFSLFLNAAVIQQIVPNGEVFPKYTK